MYVIYVLRNQKSSHIRFQKIITQYRFMKFRNILFFPATFFCANKQRLTEQQATAKNDF